MVVVSVVVAIDAVASRSSSVHATIDIEVVIIG